MDKPDLQPLFDELADLYEYGHVVLATNPDIFFRGVINEIRRLRLQVEALTPEEGVE